jgi:predicted AlkP superfamily phosphohydrolase/phosphomutase
MPYSWNWNRREMPTRKQRQLLIGLDAMEWALVLRWASEGKLPAFRELLDQGARVELSSTAVQLPDTVWPAIYSGTNPARFAKYFYVQYDPQSGDLRMLDDDIGITPFWEHLSEAGMRVCVLDAPKSPVSRRIEGFHVANWGAHGTHTLRASNPQGLLGEMDERFGPHPVSDCDAVDRKPKALRNLRQRLLDGVQLRGAVCRFLMEREDWDVFFAGFAEMHCAGHHFWEFHDAANAHHDPAGSDGLRDTVEAVYSAVDRQVGEMLRLAGSATRCLLFSGHGMGPLQHASWNLQEILDLYGFGRTGARRTSGSRAANARVNPWRLLKMSLPGRFQYAVKAVLPKPVQDELIFRWYAGGREWSGCRAIAIPNNESAGAVRILVEGRDRHGRVPPGAEYRKVRDGIAAALGELVDPRTGRKVVRQVSFTQEEFQGAFLDGLPDLTVLWDQSFVWDEVASPRIGRLKLRRQDSRNGSHTPYGFMLVRGYGERPGAELPRATLYDIAPTILSAAGIEVPKGMEGRPLFAGFEEP